MSSVLILKETFDFKHFFCFGIQDIIPNFMNSLKIEKVVRSADELKALAGTLIEENPHKIWLLYGDLGAGKTTFTQGLASHFGASSDEVKSPTFAIFQEYPNWVHYDTYRIGALDSMLMAGIEEQLMAGKSIVLEWPETSEAFFEARPHVKVHLEHHPEGRKIRVLIP